MTHSTIPGFVQLCGAWGSRPLPAASAGAAVPACSPPTSGERAGEELEGPVWHFSLQWLQGCLWMPPVLKALGFYFASVFILFFFPFPFQVRAPCNLYPSASNDWDTVAETRAGDPKLHELSEASRQVGREEEMKRRWRGEEKKETREERAERAGGRRCFLYRADHLASFTVWDLGRRWQMPHRVCCPVEFLAHIPS